MTPWLLALLAAAPAGSAGPAGQAIGWVDLSDAIRNTAAGREVKAALDQEQARVNRELRAREEKLKTVADPAAYDREAKLLQEEPAKQQEAMEKKQEELLAPIIAKMKAILAEHPEVIDLSQQPLLDPPAKCNFTGWLSRAYQKSAPPPRSFCRFDRFAYVALDRALATSEMGKAATRRLDALKEQSQAEIDRRQRELAEVERTLTSGTPQERQLFERKRRELAQLFARHQRDLAATERETEDQLYAKLQKKLSAAAKQRAGLTFVEAFEQQPPRLEPSCEATEWAAKLLDDTAGKVELEKICPVKP